MPEGQDFLSLGLDISGFDAAKMATLQKYIGLFDQLSKYDGKVINPILGPGLADLNSSISQTSVLLDSINSKLSQFTANTNTAAGATRAATSGSKELTEEQAKQKVQIQELNRLKLEQAKAENLMVQSRKNAKAAITEQIASENQFSKQLEADYALISKMREKDAAQDILNNKAKAKSDIEYGNLVGQMNKRLSKSRSDQAILDERYGNDLSKLRKAQQAESKRSEAQSVKEGAANKLLADNYYQLTLTLKEQASAYKNLYLTKGAGDPNTKFALENYRETAGVIGEVDRKLQDAQPKAFGLGKGLSTMYNRLRIIAYILPGIGIAGIFNLAFEAIGAAAEKLDLFSDKTERQMQNQIRLNNVFEEYRDLLVDIEKEFKSPINAFGILNNAGQNLSDRVSKLKSEGKSELDIMKSERDLINANALQANKLFFSSGGSSKLDELSAKLEGAKVRLIDIYRAFSEADTKFNSSNKKDYKNPYQGDLDFAKSELETAKKNYSEQKDIVEKNAQLNQDLRSKDLDITKYVEEQKRKLILETAKTQSDSIKANNELTLDYEGSTLSKKLSALDNIKNATISALEAEKEYAISRPDARNTNADGSKGDYTTETKASILKANESINEVTKKTLATRLAMIEDYNQRILSAQLGIDSAALEAQIVRQGKIYKNEQKSYSERLSAYLEYLRLVQEQQDAQYKRDINHISLNTGDEASKKELENIKAQRDLQILNSRADAEKQIYDITYNEQQKRLKSIEDTNKTEEGYRREAYINELTALNEQNKRKEISNTKYKEDRKKIQQKYNDIYLTDEIADDEKLTKALRDNRDKINSELGTAQSDFASAKTQLDKDNASGRIEASKKSLEDNEKALKTSEDKEQEDRKKRAENYVVDEKKLQKERFEAIREVENELYKDIKSFADAGYEYRLSIIEKNKAAIDEQYQYEQAAIAKSSLSQKDKNALDIQLAEQKKEYDKKAQVDERRVKIEQAEFDKKLAIAHIIINTAAAVVEALPNVSKSIAVGIVGALELATVIETPIPSFAKGVKNFEGGVARTGEAGMEIIKEPGKMARLVSRENISYLAKGTDVIPIKDSPVFEDRIQSDGWDQTLFLAKEIKRLKQPQRKIINVVKIDLGFETYKKSILSNG